MRVCVLREEVCCGDGCSEKLGQLIMSNVNGNVGIMINPGSSLELRLATK